MTPRTSVDESSHLLSNSDFLQDDVVDEHEILSYVQQRRASIVSAGTNHIPNHFHTLTSHKSRSSLHDNHLHHLNSNSSFLQNDLDISEILSINSNNLIKEPETNFKTEIQVLLKYSIPLIITFLLQYSLTVASVFSVGRLGSVELAAVSLSSMTANISGYAIIQGVSTCLDTLCAQAYGRGDFNTVGLHFIRCNYLLMMLYVPMLILWVFGSKPILTMLLGSDSSRLIELASSYLKILSIGIPGFIIFENSKHFLQSQGIFHASTYILIICAPLNAFLNYLLVWNSKIGLGFIGAPLSVVITNYLMCFLLLCYIFLINGYQCIPRQSIFNKVMFQNWNKMINLSIPGVLMVEAEWLAFEIITFSASKFGTDILAAQSIVSTTCVLLYQIPFALSIAASTRIAWFIGAASKKAAIISSNATILLSLIGGLISGGFLIIFRSFFASLYTSDSNVIKIASKVLIIGSIYQINDFLAASTGGILRGQGRQKIGGILCLISYYLIALPFAFLFAFYFKLELVGLWLGMIIALFFVSISQCYCVITSKWDHIINECINEGILEDGISIDAHSIVPSMSSSHIV